MHNNIFNGATPAHRRKVAVPRDRHEMGCKPIKLTIETMEPNPHNVVGEKPSD
jgi:hypothetical protein